VHVVYPPRRGLPLAVQKLIDFLAEGFQQQPSGILPAGTS
jgi:hypothetical protein